jgi:hypothetical protein
VEIISPLLENFIQDNFPDVEEDRLAEVAQTLVEIVLSEERSVLNEEEAAAEIVRKKLREDQMAKASRKPTSYHERQVYSKSSEGYSHERRSSKSSSIGTR